MIDKPTTPSDPAPRSRRRRAADPAAAAPGTSIAAPNPTDAGVAETPATFAPPLVHVAPAGEVERRAAGVIRAQEIRVRAGVVGGLAGDHASVEMGLVGGIAAREATVSRGAVRTVLAQDVRLEQSLVQTVVANRVEVGPTTAIAFVVARRLDGNARILFDWRGALAFGAALGAFLALIRISRRRA
jgi:hypothetical protein